MEREPGKAAAAPHAQTLLQAVATLPGVGAGAVPDAAADPPGTTDTAGHPICPAWSRLFDALPLPPSLVAVGIALTLLALLLALDLHEGRLDDLLRGVTPWWQHVEVRSALAVAALFAGTAATYRFEEIGARNDLERLEPHLRRDAACESALAEVTRAATLHDVRAAGILGSILFVLVVPTLYREPERFLHLETYRLPSVLFDLLIAALLGGTILRTLYAGIVQDRAFARLAHSIAEIDLLEPGAVSVFARRGLRRALRWLVLASFASLLVFDAGWDGPPALVFVAIVAFALVSFVLPIRGAHQRVRGEKERTLVTLRRAIRSERERSARGEGTGGRLADLLAYEARIASVSEWPIDGFTLLRLSFYLFLPVGSWLGGALVERLVSRLLG